MSTPNLPANKPMLGKNGFTYKSQYGVVIICIDEADQQAVFSEQTSQHKNTGRKIKVVSV
ncbi:MAG: hypothetical protein WAU37_09620 [Formosimonas sp.]